MAVPDLPEDLIAFLQADTSPTVAAGSYGVLHLLPADRLRVELLPVKPTLSPIAGEDPQAGDAGHYAVPAVNLVVGDPEAPGRFPEWLLLWLPGERRFGAYDAGHRDLMVFGAEVRWSDIAADAPRYLAAAEGDRNATLAIEFFRPWPAYPYTRVGREHRP